LNKASDKLVSQPVTVLLDRLQHSLLVLKMKFSANLGFLFPEATSIIEQYQLSRAAGFKAVEHPFPLANVDLNKLLEVKKETGLKVALVNIQLNEDTKVSSPAKFK
jgi:hypothetical protein